MHKLFSIFLIGFVLVASSFVQHQTKVHKIETIVIDAGHGGKDPGCRGAHLREKHVALDLALRVGRLLKDSIPGVQIIYTRKTDKFIPLWQRANIANKYNADLFISLHCNANRNPQASGTETYVMGLHKSDGNLFVSKRENSSILMEDNYQNNQHYMGYSPNSSEGHIIMSLFQHAHLNQSLTLAETLQSKFEEQLPIRNRGVKQAGFVVLWRSSMPSILVESGFLTNRNDESLLASNAGKNGIALSVMKAVKDYKVMYEDGASR